MKVLTHTLVIHVIAQELKHLPYVTTLITYY